MRALILVAVTLIGTTPMAVAGQYRPWRTSVAMEGPLEARGCYWYRQRQHCGRYCYTENDGRRFCRRRVYEAVPQAPQDYDEYRSTGHGHVPVK